MSVRVFGIRHHGPGSARALEAALRSWQPSTVLIEGPPEAAPVLALAASPAMRPPVALLSYLPGKPSKAAFYPFATWSPEWVALRHALFAGVPVQMIDLPAGVMLQSEEARAPRPTGDPLSFLAEAAGYDDTERWWEDVIEHRLGDGPWEAIIEAIAELRAHSPEPDQLEARREGSMRQHVRAAAKVHDRVAVVCGAWHAPVLAELGPARADQELLAGLPRERAVVTWAPWTYNRLSFASGYGAGVTSPGWYEHLYSSPDRPIERWMVKVTSLLRDERVDAPPASAIDAVRLADALASIRGRPLAGLSECTDAVRATITGGSDQVLGLVARKLVVGDVIGEVPPETPMVALATDLASEQRRLRMKPAPVPKEIELDLRKDTDLQRSHLLHRLNLLGVPWGTPSFETRGTGTFREAWALGWHPELAVRVVEASVYGATVEAAASSRAVERASEASDVAGVTLVMEACLLADLPTALPPVMATLDSRAALSSDVAELMEAVLPLARVARYGSVRQSDAKAVTGLVRALVARAAAGLVPACANLDEEAAEAMTGLVTSVSAALTVLDDAPLRTEWNEALKTVSASATLSGLLVGRCCRVLLDAGEIEAADVAARLASALSPGEEPSRGAGWVEGLVSGSGLVLVHDPVLLALIDEWLSSVSEEVFDDVLPLLRRSFATFQPGESRQIARAAAHLDGRGPSAARVGDLGDSGPGAGGAPSAGEAVGAGGSLGEATDPERARAVLPVLRLIFGPHRGALGAPAPEAPANHHATEHTNEHATEHGSEHGSEHAGGGGGGGGGGGDGEHRGGLDSGHDIGRGGEPPEIA